MFMIQHELASEHNATAIKDGLSSVVNVKDPVALPYYFTPSTKSETPFRAESSHEYRLYRVLSN